MDETAAKVAKWLANSGMKDIKPVCVTVASMQRSGKTVNFKNTQTWVGCEYRDTRRHRAAGDGELTIYLVGPRFQRRGRFCFTVNGQDWYTAAYIDEVKPEFAEYHPFGVSWMITPWTAPTPIDSGEIPGRPRVELKIEYLN